MARFSRLCAGLSILAVASLTGALVSSPFADAKSRFRHALASPCSAKLQGYQPALESAYEAKIGSSLFFLDQVQEDGNGSLSGASVYETTNPLRLYVGTFAGKIIGDAIQGQGSVSPAGWSFSFTGTATCLLSQISATDVVTTPSGRLPSALRLTTVCELGAAYGLSVPAGLLPACEARQVLDGLPQPGWDNGAPIPGNGAIPYSWGGGHPLEKGEGTRGNGTIPGPSYGTCLAGYSGPDATPLSSCLAFRQGPYNTIGLDCSGFTRWIFYLIMSSDVLGPGGTSTQVSRLPDGSDAAGSLVYFTNREGTFIHAGIVIAPGEMIDEPDTLGSLRADRITPGFGTSYYKTYDFSPQP